MTPIAAKHEKHGSKQFCEASVSLFATGETEAPGVSTACCSYEARSHSDPTQRALPSSFVSSQAKARWGCPCRDPPHPYDPLQLGHREAAFPRLHTPPGERQHPRGWLWETHLRASRLHLCREPLEATVQSLQVGEAAGWGSYEGKLPTAED